MSAKGGFTIGPSHAEGGIPMTVKSTGQKIEVEGGEGIINKHSMADNRVYEVKGTPKQIASAINEIDGNGVSFDEGAEITMLEKGGMLYEPYVSNKYAKNKNQYDFYVNDGAEYHKIGQAKVKPHYGIKDTIKIDELKIDDEFSNPKVYSYYTQALLDKANVKQAELKIECIDDVCIAHFLELGELNNDCDKLYIR